MIHRNTWKFLLGALGLFILCSSAHAQVAPVAPAGVPWYNLKERGTAAVAGGYAWHTGTASNLPSITKEWQVGVSGAYNIVPGISGAGYVVRGFDNHTWRAAAGPRLTVWKSQDKAQAAAVSLAYAWHAGPPENLPTFKHEWEVGALYGISINPRVVLGASSNYGLDNKTFRSAISLAYSLTGGVR